MELSGTGTVRFAIDNLDLVEGTYKLDSRCTSATALPTTITGSSPRSA